MAARRFPCICLSVIFLATIAAVAASQIIVEWREGGSPQIAELFRQKPTRANLGRLESGLESGCRIGQMVRPWVQLARFVLFEDAGDNAVLGRNGWFFYRPAVQYLVEPWSPEGGQTQGNVFDAILSFHDDLAKRGIRLLVMPAPNKASVYPEMLTGRAHANAGPINPATLHILARLRQAGVEVLDLFEVYDRAKRAAASPAYYLAQDSHWSPEGMRLAAEAVGNRLLDLGWIEKGATRYKTEPAAVERHGDVLRMIRVPQVERLFEPQRMDCTQVIDTGTGQPYADDPNSPVLVLGDSFLRIFERDEPGSGGFIAHLAYNLGFGLSSIVSDGGASTLVRQQLARKAALLEGKRVVVWEFVERDFRFGTEGWQRVPLPPE
ncbi:MAG TPA: hypothetical protein PLU87_05700 [Sedimentisphaerales bacterium]|nr:hypothetical protein [Sedimentisphaerales bacterium]HRS10420.1 hypothetical protein [Sedimentisphaerales bacterium]HRV47125.1 hypothetical protein [Sedimentisphaerales bacterium]